MSDFTEIRHEFDERHVTVNGRVVTLYQAKDDEERRDFIVDVVCLVIMLGITYALVCFFGWS